MNLKILSWNIWCGTHLPEVIEFLKTSDADIIALQETCIDARGNIADIIAKELDYECANAIGTDFHLKFLPGHTDDEKGTMKFGTSILSKHKIIKSEIIELTKEDNRLIVKADIEVEGQTLHVFSIHLKHTHQQPSELQSQQVENLTKIINKEKTIVMGDFNALPESATIKKMSQVLKNAEVGIATPTWSVYEEGCHICLIGEVKHKLDYIFTSNDIKVDSFTVHKSKAADHLPVSAIITIN